MAIKIATYSITSNHECSSGLFDKAHLQFTKKDASLRPELKEKIPRAFLGDEPLLFAGPEWRSPA